MNTLAQYGFKKPKPVVPEPVKRRPGRPSKAAKSAEEERAAAAKREADAAYDHELELVATAQEEQWEAEKAEHDRRHKKRTKGHMNWSLPENQAVLAPAVKGWLGGSAHGISMEKWCMKHSTEHITLKKGTFSQYVSPNESKRLKLVEDGGNAVGNPPTLDQEDSQLLVDVIRRSDRGNEPKSMPQIMGVIQELKPTLNIKATRNAFATVQKKHKAELTGKIKAQATTTARSAITIPQQFRWHTMIDSMYSEMVKLNTEEGGGDAPDSWRQSFYVVMEHFLMNGDETCMIAKDCRVHIIGDKAKKSTRPILMTQGFR